MKSGISPILITVLVLVAAAIAVAATSYNTMNYMEQGGARWQVGGLLNIRPGGKLTSQSGATANLAKLQAQALSMYASAADSLAVNSAMYGEIIAHSPTGAASVTLPANGAPAGSWIEYLLIADQSATISPTTAGTLIANGTTTANSVAFSTTGHKAGSCALFISNGSQWVAINQGDTTMTVN